MKTIKLSVFSVFCALVIGAYAVPAQDSVFSDPAVDYNFTVPEGKWKMTVKPSATSPNVEYVYGDRFDGHLEVRKVTVPRDSIMADIVEEEEKRLQFRQGFAAGTQDNFTGKLRGAVYNFEYIAGGRNMSGRFYFLKANETTVYVLRFTGQKDSLRSIRSQTDSISRTFAVKS